MTSISTIWKELISILSILHNFYSLEVVDRVSETQLQVGKKFQLNNLAVKGLKTWNNTFTTNFTFNTMPSHNALHKLINWDIITFTFSWNPAFSCYPCVLTEKGSPNFPNEMLEQRKWCSVSRKGDTIMIMYLRRQDVNSGIQFISMFLKIDCKVAEEGAICRVEEESLFCSHARCLVR